MNLLDYVIVLLYFAVMIGAGYWGLTRARSAEDYLVAGRRLGPFMYIGCLSAVVLGGASTIGSVAVVIFMVKDGLFANSPIIWGLVASLVTFVVVSLLTPKPSEESMAVWEHRLTEGGTARVSE
jgi:SSS family solute:Na+ symporter